MRVSAKLFGTKATRDALKRVAAAGGQTANAVTVEASEQLLFKIKDLIQSGPKTGRVYRRYNPFRIHQASAPGQPPAEDLGRLSNSFGIEYKKLNQYAYSATVGSDLVYAAALEYGNPSTNLLPRPYLSVAVREQEREMGGIITEEWKRFS